ncbi:hypothetical protein IVB16_27430 [Bradyrhizobium sp. 183]|uniref:DUF6173 family protein n=1 Tax=unclassified Bradyrhizobium TaxID=2631580 RepID=UPI001FF96107|nr:MULTISPECIES: DUF6173 family protein [unclassified Bradyrhizobium]MCK1562440.1 hypothetical protein [Bradyrhizobium sp. 173]UPJ78583.1 hypothetical protein IVB17_27430 [Bradyrhizobium sp. 184]UPJ86378.1 hypothetical protein IVB16_27430 [Bradyrhizobium sp. 183]
MRTIVDDIAEVTASLDRQQRRKNNPAEYIHQRMSQLIANFQNSLSDDVEVGINVVGSGAAAPFRLRTMTVSNPDILIFDGIDDRGARVRLLQHYTQTAVMLVVLPKADEKPYRIGFT